MKNKIKIEDKPNCMTVYFHGNYNDHKFTISDSNDGIFVSFDGMWGKSSHEHRTAINEIVRKYKKKREKLFRF